MFVGGHRPAEPLTIDDAAQALVDAGWADSYEEAREDLEQARAQVAAEQAAGADSIERPV